MAAFLHLAGAGVPGGLSGSAAQWKRSAQAVQQDITPSSCSCQSGVCCFLRATKQPFNQQHAIMEALYLLEPDALVFLRLGLPGKLSLE